MLNFAFDLGTALDIVSGVRLGPGKISVHPAKLGVAGHGFGASAAVFAAAGMPANPAAVAAVFPSVTSPPAEQPAATLRVPGVIFTAPGDAKTLNSNALALAEVWDAATVRVINKAEPGGLVEGRRLTKVVGLAGAHRRTQRSVRALLTGYLLYVGRRQEVPRLRRSARAAARDGGPRSRGRRRAAGREDRRPAEVRWRRGKHL